MAGKQSKAWADGPFKLISSSRVGSVRGKTKADSSIFAEEMTIIHNVILRGLNSIYLQCVNVAQSEKDVPDFVEYALQWAELLTGHHKAEETDYFPFIDEKAEAPGLMSGNVEQHKQFHDGFEAMETYLHAVKDGKEKYNGLKLRGIIDSFGNVLAVHMSDEIDTLLELSKYEDKCDWNTLFKKKNEEMMKKSNDPKYKTTAVPFIFSNHDSTFEDGVYGSWPPLPWFAKPLFRWFFIPVHKDWWRFAPCDYYLKPKELPFA